jgi:hypothetical protein
LADAEIVVDQEGVAKHIGAELGPSWSEPLLGQGQKSDYRAYPGLVGIGLAKIHDG